MRAEALLVAWHMVQYPEPVLAADFSPLSQRLATCGADNTVKVCLCITHTHTHAERRETVRSLTKTKHDKLLT